MKKILAILIAMSLISGTAFAFASTQKGKETEVPAAPAAKELCLYVNSPLAVKDGEIVPLDSENPGVVPILEGGRAMVPLRAVAGHFGSAVSYDSKSGDAAMKYGQHQYTFPAGEKYYIVDGENKVAMDAASFEAEGRIMVPLRAIAEGIMGKAVSYSKNVIIIGDKTYSLSSGDGLYSQIKDKIGKAIRPSSLNDVKDALIAGGYTDRQINNEDGAASKQILYSARTEATVEVAESSSGSGGYSDTNIQVEGIDESDIVKTDGEYIYIAANNKISIVKADAGTMEKVGSIAFRDDYYINDIYIDKNRVVALGNYYENFHSASKGIAVESASDDGEGSAVSQKDIATSRIGGLARPKNYAYAGVYDTSDKSNPKKLKELMVEGNLHSSRKKGDYVYIAANNYTYCAVPLARAGESDLLPYYMDSTKGDTAQNISLDNLMICPVKETSNFTTIAVLDIADSKKAAKIESFMGSMQHLYMNDSSIYLAFYEYEENKEKTGFLALDADDMKIGFRASGSVDGYLLNQFAMDEHNGYFRAATSEWDTSEKNGEGSKSSNLYVMDSHLNMKGHIDGIAKGEQIYAVRFMGDKGYLVTYETVDPLFTLDLSDPQNPKISGQLKVPGFSNYLHPVGNDKILGLGRETQEMYVKDKNGKETVIGTRQAGIKLSLFDVSDFANPKELDTMIVGNGGIYSEALNSHKAFMADDSRGLYGFCAEIWEDGSDDVTGAFLFEVNGNAIKRKGNIPYEEPKRQEGDYAYYSRLCYIGDTLYYLQDGLIRSFDLNSLQEIGKITV